jgi:hypothetical protein
MTNRTASKFWTPDKEIEMSKYSDLAPNRGLFWLLDKRIGFGVALIAVFYLFILPLFVAEKAADWQVQKFDAGISAQVYDNSRSYQQGLNRDIARYYRSRAGRLTGGKRTPRWLSRTW